MQRCANCGYKNDFNIKTCQLCSHKLDEPPRRVAGADMGVAPAAGTTTKRILGGMNAERHYMVPLVGDFVKLEPGFSYLMGRDAACRIRVGSPKVSRKHAEIVFAGEPSRPHVKDLGSQNGTRVNGQPIPKEGVRELKDMDEVEVGDVKITYRKLAAGEPERVLRQDAGESTETNFSPYVSPTAPTVDGEDAPDAAMMGDATFIPLAQVVNRLAELKATGLLMVEAHGSTGFVQFQGGRAVGGTFAGTSGPAAASVVASLTAGKFRFEAADMPAPAPAPAPSPSDSQRPTQRMAPLPPPTGMGTLAPPPGTGRATPAPRPAGPSPGPAQPPRPTRPLGPPPGPGGAPPPRPQAPPPPPKS